MEKSTIQQYIQIARDGFAEIRIRAPREWLKTPEKEAAAKKLIQDQYVDSFVSQVEQAGIRPKRSVATSQISGADAQGSSFDVDCTLDNISSSGLYLRLRDQLKLGVDLNVIVKFADGTKPGATAVLSCEVLRDEVQADGQHGIAMAIKKYYFVEPQPA